MNVFKAEKLACCKAGLEECQAFLGVILHFQTSLAKECSAETLASFCQARATRFATLKERLGSECCAASAGEPELAPILAERLRVIQEILTRDEEIKELLWQEQDNTRKQILQLQHLRRGVKGYKLGVVREPRFIDQHR